MFILHIFYKLYIDPQNCFSFKLLSFIFLCSHQNNQVNLDRSGIFLTLFLPPKTPPVVEPQYFFWLVQQRFLCRCFMTKFQLFTFPFVASLFLFWPRVESSWEQRQEFNTGALQQAFSLPWYGCAALPGGWNPSYWNTIMTKAFVCSGSLFSQI